MATKWELIRQAIQAEEKQKENTNSGGDNSVYRFWDLSDDSKKGNSATIRFLPDKDDDNLFFWKERQIIKLTFNGIVGQMDSKEVSVTVPCMRMFG
ncbi:MAG: hypothetical protein WC284_19105, partial [Candidimonas sp.]